MIAADSKVKRMINAPVRKIDARVELYEGSPSVNEYNKTLLNVFTSGDALQSFSVERLGEHSMFFGFGICQKLTVVLIDKDRQINITKGNIMEVAFNVEEQATYPCPLFRVDSITRDENNNNLTIVAYDFLYKAGEFRTSDIEEDSYTIREYVHMCANLLGLPVKFAVDEAEQYIFDETYPQGANFSKKETLRQALDSIAAATQTVYFVDWDWQLTFKRLDKNMLPVDVIDKSKYFTLSSKGDIVLGTVCHATEIGESVSATACEGVTQYVRDNAWWELRDDIDVVLTRAINAVGGMSMHQINMTWRGDYLIEIGDRFSVVTKDNLTVNCYLLSDTMTYNGGLKQVTTWTYTENASESASNPITIGDALNQTVARVDKVNKQIELLVSETSDYSDRLSQIEMTTNGINATVSRVERSTDSQLAEMNGEITELTRKVDMAVTAEDVTIQISKEIARGTTSVTTTTGFEFNDEGLTISKSDSEMETNISEDGMVVSRRGTEVLVANNEGVRAKNLHATTYLIIGDNSRFEDYGYGRTGCFYIG